MRQFFVKTILLFLGLSFGIAILETGIRFFPEQAPPRLLGLIEPDQYIGTIYKKNLDTYIEAEDDKKNTIPFRTNSFGFIGENWASKKQEIRIVNHGDSFTAGSAVPYEKNYVSLLGNIVSGRTGTVIKSLNFGVVGQGTREALETYRHYGQQAQGDMVLLWMYLGNDFYDNLENSIVQESDATVAEEAQTEQKISFAVALLRKSELVRFVKDTVAQAPWGHRVFSILSGIPGVGQFIYKVTLAEYPPKIPVDLLLMFTDYEQNETALNETRKYLQEFSTTVKDDGGEFFVILIPAHFQVDPDAYARLTKQYPELLERGFDKFQPNRVLQETLKGLDIPYYDLTNSFVAQYENGGEQLYICRFCHLSESGHTLAAEESANFLYERYFKSP